MNETSPERTGWRDLALSRRHRQWGIDCPMVDIDLLALEYDCAKARAIVEYKHERALPRQFASRANYRALIDLGDRAGLPVFVARYPSDISWLWATPLNEQAREFLPEATLLTEPQWVKILYRVRGRSVPDGLFELMEVEV